MSTAAAQYEDSQHSAGEDRTPLPLRADTFLGVCEAVGEDLGINANWIRLAFAPVILFSPIIAIAAYLGLGVVVAASRWVFPAQPQVDSQVRDSAEADDEDVSEERLAA